MPPSFPILGAEGSRRHFSQDITQEWSENIQRSWRQNQLKGRTELSRQDSRREESATQLEVDVEACLWRSFCHFEGLTATVPSAGMAVTGRTVPLADRHLVIADKTAHFLAGQDRQRKGLFVLGTLISLIKEKTDAAGFRVLLGSRDEKAKGVRNELASCVFLFLAIKLSQGTNRHDVTTYKCTDVPWMCVISYMWIGLICEWSTVISCLLGN